MVFFILLDLWTAMNAYVAWRLYCVPTVARHVRPSLLVGAMLILWGSFPLYHLLERQNDVVLVQAIGYIGSYWLGISFLLFVPLFAVDLVTGFGFWGRRLSASARSVAVVAGCTLAAIAIVQGTRSPIVQSYELTVTKLSPEYEGSVLVVASDLHLGALTTGNFVSGLVKQINSQNPDFILLAGDTVEDHSAHVRKLLGMLNSLSARKGVWAVDGTHESYHPENASEKNESVLESAGFRVLHNQWAEPSRGIIISGVDDLSAQGHRERATRALNQALGRRPPGFTILISHAPLLADQAAAQSVGLLVSGHTHNGQVWPFNYVVRTIYPFLAGQYTLGEMPIIVCRGTGTWGPRMRLWERGEVLRITLHTR